MRSTPAIENLLRDHFNLENVKVKKMVGYENENYRIDTADQRYVLKLYPFDAGLMALTMAETETLLFINQDHREIFPMPVPSITGAYVEEIEFEGTSKIMRMLSFVDGEFVGDVVRDEKLFKSLGSFLGNLDKSLMSMVNHSIKARQTVWDNQYLLLNKKFLPDIVDAHDRYLVAYFIQQYGIHVIPRSGDLRKSIIHNDANEWNVLCTDGQVSGIIDFGDLVESYLINELAIAIAYAAMDQPDPLYCATTIVDAYHAVLPLQEREADVLYYLVAARLCISVSNTAHNKKLYPENDYISISEQPAWRLLRKWLTINPIDAQNSFRKAIGAEPLSIKPMSALLEERQVFISPAISLSYASPIHMSGAAFQYMYDAEGNTFLDAYNNIPHVGHSHPRVVEAGQRQMAILNTNTRYVYDLLSEYAGRLLQKFPDPLSKVFFVNSGSAASDLAIRMAKTYTGHQGVMVMEHGYHGHTQTDIDISDYKFNHAQGQGQKDYVLKVPIPVTYRGKFKADDPQAGINYAKEAIALLQKSEVPVAAFISEPIVGCGGQVPLAPGYLKQLYPAIRQQGGVCISDEVQVGFGRLGNVFWGFEAQEVIPDIVVIGKPMGNGHPMGAVITTDAIAESFDNGVEFFSSFGGNPVSCAIGLAVLDVIEEELLQQHAAEVGTYYKNQLTELSHRFPSIGDVRGSGLFLGVELIVPETMAPDTDLAQKIKNELRNNYILMGTDGPFDNVLKSKPPLCFTKDNVDQVINEINNILITHAN